MNLANELLANDGLPLVEVKMGVVLYLPAPAPVGMVRNIVLLYFERFGDGINCFKSTAPGSIVVDWDDKSLGDFLGKNLQNLYRRTDWGYVFSDGRTKNSRLFMFHGFRSASEPGKASFLRFDFDDKIDANQVMSFSKDLLAETSFHFGSGGYFFFNRSDPHYAAQSHDRSFGLAQRYLGIEAQNIEVTAMHASGGLKCVNWITLLGRELVNNHRTAVERARHLAFSSYETSNGVIIQAAPRPLLGDRNRNEKLTEYIAVANALSELQMQEHEPFGGNLWTELNTIDYVRRFNTAN